ncbi:MAG: hypothetical protein AAGA91_07770 [Pseudomonadota bacterium]
MSRPAAILGGGVNGLAVARSLGRQSIAVYLFTTEVRDIAATSRFVSCAIHVDTDHPESFVAELAFIASKHGAKPIIIHTSDDFLMLSSTHRAALEPYCDVNLPATEIVERVIDKGAFNAFCAAQELPAPLSWCPRSQADLQHCIAGACFPLVIKPALSNSIGRYRFVKDGKPRKMVHVKTAAELQTQFEELYSPECPLLVQEFIEGADSEHYSFFSYRSKDHRELIGFGVRKKRIYPVHSGAGTCVEICEEPELAKAARQVIDVLGYTGSSSTCFKRCALTGKLVLHEVNGRLPAWHGISQLGNLDLPLMAYRYECGLQTEIGRVEANKGNWIILRSDFAAFRAYRKRGELSILQWLRSLAHARVCAEFARDDLHPLFHHLGAMMRRTIERQQ